MILMLFEDTEVARKFLASLQGPTLEWPLKAFLPQHIPAEGSARARLTQSEESTPSHVAHIGLGLQMETQPEPGPYRSFIGDDRVY